MKKNITIVIISIAISAFLVSNVALAEGLDLLGRLNRVADKMGYDVMGMDGDVENPMSVIAIAIGTLLNWILGLLGVIFMGLIIYAGLRWMTARGNEKQVEDSKKILINASIGIMIVAIAFAFTIFISFIIRSVGMFQG